MNSTAQNSQQPEPDTRTVLVEDLVDFFDDTTASPSPPMGPVSLVGDSGGRSLVTGEVSWSSTMAGMVRVETEHGVLYLDEGGQVEVAEE